MQAVFIALRPFDSAANVRRTVYVGDAPSGEGFGAGGVAWQPILVQRPRLSIELFSAQMDGKVQTGKAAFAIALDRLKGVARPRDLVWRGALVQIWIGDRVEGPAPEPDFSGYVTGPALDTDTGKLTITAEVTDTLIDRPLLTKTFGGGGGIDGDAGKRGVFLPAGFGRVYNIEPIWFDTTRNIGMIDGYGNCLAINALFEGLNGFGARVADYPTYTALAAAIDAKTVKPGQWATCVASGLVGLGAPPEKPITVHAQFGANRPGSMMARIAAIHAGVSAALIDVNSFAALDVMVNRPTGYWTAEQRNCKDLLEAIARSCNATPLITFQGRVSVARAVPSASVYTLDRTGNAEPRVVRYRAGQVEPPYFQIRARTARPARVLSNDEVNYVDSLIDRGLYSATETYRAGNIVWLSDGSQWLYTSAVPTSGNSPAVILPPDTVGDYWTQMQPPKKATDFRYATGETIESLKPAERGANVTGTNISAGISGQGALATRSYADWASQVAGAGKPADNATVGAITGGNLVSGYGRGILTDDGIFTQLGVSAGFYGQGSLATQNAVTYGSQITGLPGPIQPGNLLGGGLYLDARQMQYWGGPAVQTLMPAQAGADVTGSNVAAAISGQGALATRSTVIDGYLGGTLSVRLAPHPLNSNFLGTDTIAYPGGAGVSTLQPQEGGANKTETRVASAIAGQGLLATRNFADWASQVLGAGKPENGATVGAITGGNLQSGYGRGILTDDGIFTQLGISAGFAGQGALATLNQVGSAQVAPGAVTGSKLGIGDKSNMIADGDLIDPGYWSAIGTSYSLNQAPTNLGYASRNYLRLPSTVGNSAALGQPFPAQAGQPYVVSAIIASAAGSEIAWTGLLWYADAAGTQLISETVVGYRAQPVFSSAQDSRLAACVKAPAGTMSARMHFTRLGGGTYPVDFAEPIVRRAIDFGLITDDAVRLGANIRRADATTLVTESLVVTGLGTAAAISGQGAFATLNTVGYGSSYLIGFGGLAALDRVRLGVLGAGGIVDAANSRWLGDYDLITGLGIASAVSGQGALATQNAVTYGSQISGLPGPIQPGNLLGGGLYLDARQMQYWGGPAVQTLMPAQAGADVTGSNVAAAITGQSSWATYGGLVPGNVAGQVQGLDTSGNLSGLARVIDRRITLLVRADGTTVVTESLVVTAIGVAAAIAGQGAGATANSLAQLDPSAASQLAAVAGGGIQAVALYATIRKVMDPGATINLDAAAGINAGGNSGNVRVLIQVSPAGANSWSNVAAGASQFVSASEPAYVTASGSYTNSSGVQQVYEFRAIDDRTPGSAGGGVIASQSFLRG